ncbi:MAG: fibronectin type III domain-containing protein, partial [Acidobacteriota bacterium]|nr:fibronectin type III domain-containing protein [Acidobacteriota bacterium]
SADRKLTLLAETKEAEVVRLMDGAGGALLAATANMGRIYKLGAAGTKGTYESPVFDAGSVARWGKLRWQGAGTVAIRTRSGNSMRPDSTWSDWEAAAQIVSPNARYLQFTAELSNGGTIDSVTAAYLPQNNPPAIRSISVIAQLKAAPVAATTNSGPTAFSVTVTDTGDAAPAASTGTATQTLSRAASQQLQISWQADDPDSDKLVYQLDFRGEGERDWKRLRANLRENTYTVDGDALADGRYWFRVSASDRESNAAGSEKEAELVSAPVLIDNTPPVIRIRSASRTEVIFEAQDAASILRKAEWSVDAGAWTPLAPVDGILDSQTERFRFEPDHIPAGEHLLVLRVTDSGNNTALARVILH